jgi:hypothetical protein
MKKSIFKRFMKALMMEIREHRSTFLVYSVLSLAVIAVGVLQFFNGNYENVFLCILTLILFMVPSFIQLTFKVELPTTLEIIILLFIFAAEILGEIDDYYLLFPFWDTMLHTMNGFLAAAIGFSLVNLLNDSEKIQFELSPIFVVIVAFCFSMTIGVVWEFFEFSMDQLFGMDTQKDTIIHVINSVSLSADGSMTTFKDISQVIVDGTVLPISGYLDIGLIDTMQDLMVNFIGAAVFSVFGFFYIKYKGKINLVNHFIPTKKSKERDYLEQVINE